MWARINRLRREDLEARTTPICIKSTIAASTFASTHAPSPGLAAQAAVHGYTTAFWFSAAIFAVGAITTTLLFESGAPELDPEAAPAFAH